MTVLYPAQIATTQNVIPNKLTIIEKILCNNAGKKTVTASTAACAFSLTAMLLPTKIIQTIIYLATSSDQERDALKPYLITACTKTKRDIKKWETAVNYNSI